MVSILNIDSLSFLLIMMAKGYVNIKAKDMPFIEHIRKRMTILNSMPKGKVESMAKRTKCTPETLGSVIEEVMKEYDGQLKQNAEKVTKTIGQKGAQALKNASKSTFNGDNYWKSWRQKTTKEKSGDYSVVIYSQMPGLPHLLEYGHAMRGGGRVQGREHIKPVEETLVEEYQKGIEQGL